MEFDDEGKDREAAAGSVHEPEESGEPKESTPPLPQTKEQGQQTKESKAKPDEVTAFPHGDG
eukprot:15473874-Alexandrium_andersonii.AAC.1